MHKTWEGHNKQQNSAGRRGTLHSVVDRMVLTLQAPGKELGDYTPHLYADEGDAGTNTELDAISIPDIPFDPELNSDLDIKFKTLASICMPDPSSA
ncbi:hypothetical protein LDENG_00073610 [Lucifuga dentata]|nr:hypothetical protein LDENG_00073610 [Lucifuga dentata]